MKRAPVPKFPLLVAAGLMFAADAAKAQEVAAGPTIGLGGFFNTTIGFVGDQDKGPSNGGIDTPAADVMGDSEVHFKGRVLLANGISIRAHVELEGNTDPDQIDESYIVVRGGFGQFTLGSENGVAEMMTTPYGGNSASVGAHYYLDGTDYLAREPWAGATTTTGISNYFTDGDNEKISYYTPRVFGVQIGASYIPVFDGDDTVSTPSDTSDNYNDGYAVGINLDRRIGGAAIGVGAGFLSKGKPTLSGVEKSDWAEYGFSGRIDFGALRVAADYRAIIDGFDTGFSAEGQILNLGVRYTMGPNAVSFNYITGKADGSTDNLSSNESRYMTVSAGRALGPGVTAYMSWVGADWQGEAPGPGDDNAGWAILTGLNVGF